jgi:hypothetical protein
VFAAVRLKSLTVEVSSKNRLPLCFEIFRCADGSTDDQLRLFLDRLKQCTKSTFCIVHAEKLSSRLRETLTAFLCDRSVMGYGSDLNIVQRGDFIRGSQFTTNKLHDFASYQEQLPSNWPSLIVDDSHISEIQLVSSCCSGSGKSSYVSMELEKLRQNWQTKTIAVHEKSCIGSIVRQLRPLSGQKQVALHFAINVSPNGLPSQWLTELNSFFFSLLVLRVASDPKTKTSVCLCPGSRWRVYLELPSFTRNDNPIKWLENAFPLMSLTGVHVTPPSDFIVDEETRRVCTYLRAYETGTIDRKYEDHGPKRVVFLLDCSGSMKGR